MSAAAPAQKDLAGRKLGRYEMLAPLASGGMATVYVARAQGVAGFERLVAIKVLHPHLAHDEEFISMFLDEARLAARIRHPNVVPTLDISEDQGDGYYLVMEYIEGDHFGALLREAAKQGKRLPAAASIRIVIDALEGLGAAHNLKDGDGKPLSIVHRDVSPHNILLGSDGIARITDFGVAKAEVRLSSTRDGQFKGKLSYMAPEQASTGYADQRSDLFSMGIVLWESLTSRRLFRADNNGELLNRVLNSAIPNVSEVDPALLQLDAVLQKALERDPEKRFQSSAEFVEALETAQGTSGVAPSRIVARVVKEYLGAKVENEHARIKSAIDTLGRSDISSPARAKLDIAAMTPTPSEVRSIGSEDMTVGAKPSNVDEPAAAPAPDAAANRKMIAIGAIVLGIALLGSLGAWALFGGAGADEVADGAPVPPTVPVAAPPEPPATTATAPTVVTPPPVAVDPASATPPVVEAGAATVPTTAAAGAGDESTPAAPTGGGTGRRRRHHTTGGGTGAAPAGGGSATGTGSSGSGTSGSSGDDDEDIVLNPYRH